VRRSMEETELTPQEAARLCALVDDSFAFFRAFADEMQDLAQAGSRVG
jgi:hypothetical protein